MTQAEILENHAITALALANSFQVLDVSAGIWDGQTWRSIHTVPSVIWFEVEHGVAAERERYNDRAIKEARRSRQVIVGDHAGLCDVFAPILVSGQVVATLVVGPFGKARPTTASVLERWRWLTRRQGHPDDPEFARFLDATISTLVLEGAQLRAFLAATKGLCRLIAREGSGAARDQDALQRELAEVRFVERMWQSALSLLDPGTTRSWSSSYRQPWVLGIDRLPEDALVGLAVSRDAHSDRVDELLCRDAFQRAAVKLARSVGDTVAGQVGNQGVVLLSAIGGSVARRRDRLGDLGDRLMSLARRFGFRLHVGVASVSGATLNENHQAAFTAAQSALAQGVRLVDARTAPQPQADSLIAAERRLREVLVESVMLQAELDRYLAAVALRYGYRIDPIRTYLDAVFERLVVDLSESGALDALGLRELGQALSKAERAASSLNELLAAYRSATIDLARTLEQPRRAHRERGLGRALSYIRQHYAEPLSLPEVARVAGFAPNYFSALFRRREKVTFERYVRQLRVERAKILLAQHEIEVQQVAHLSGFRERHYFNRAFRKVVGTSPLEYRSKLSGARRTKRRTRRRDARPR